MAFAYTLPIRIVQGSIAFLDLILLAYAANHWFYRSPDSVNFLIFTSVWTLLAVAYLVVAPMRFPDMAHKFAILGVEAVTLIFWFAGWIALAAFLGGLPAHNYTPAQTAAAATAFGAINWLLFTATTLMAGLHAHRTRNQHPSKHDPGMEVDARV